MKSFKVAEFDYEEEPEGCANKLLDCGQCHAITSLLVSSAKT